MKEKTNGGIAQLGEHLPCKQGVMSSNLIISTIESKTLEMMKFLRNFQRLEQSSRLCVP